MHQYLVKMFLFLLLLVLLMIGCTSVEQIPPTSEITIATSKPTLQQATASPGVLPTEGTLVSTEFTLTPTESDAPEELESLAIDERGQIVFEYIYQDTTELYLINVDGTGFTKLTNYPTNDLSPDWSPDGSSIAFVSDRDQNRKLHVMNADGSNVRKLNDVFSFAPVWSPDGQKIAFQVVQVPGHDIYVVNVDGTGLTNLTNSLSHDTSPMWLPDGEKILFLSDRNGTTELFVMNADGSDVRPWGIDFPWGVGDPELSSDGEWILYVGTKEGQSEIFSVKLDGTDLIQITDSPAGEYAPTWSPDGKQIAFVSLAHISPEIYIANSDGTGQTRLTETPDFYVAAPSWRLRPSIEPNPTSPTATPEASAIASGAILLEQLCLQGADLSALSPIPFSENAVGFDRSLVGVPESIYYTFYGTSDTVFHSVETVPQPYISDTEGAAYSIGCNLTAYQDELLAQHAVDLTTIVDFYSIPSSDYCLENECLAVAMAERPIEFLEEAQSILGYDYAVFRYAKMLTGPNLTLLARYDNIILRLNIDPWSNSVTLEQQTKLLIDLSDAIMERVITNSANEEFPAEFPVLQCRLYQGLGNCLIEILAVQLRLLQLGYEQVGEADGIFGPKTEQAVIDFQLLNELPADGVVGPQTWSVLFNSEAVHQQ